MATFHLWDDFKSVCPFVTACYTRLFCTVQFCARPVHRFCLEWFTGLVWSSLVSCLLARIQSTFKTNVDVTIHLFLWKPQNLKPVPVLVSPPPPLLLYYSLPINNFWLRTCIFISPGCVTVKTHQPAGNMVNVSHYFDSWENRLSQCSIKFSYF